MSELICLKWGEFFERYLVYFYQLKLLKCAGKSVNCDQKHVTLGHVWPLKSCFRLLLYIEKLLGVL